MSTNIARRVARCIALPAVAAGIIGGAALGLAGTANAAEGSWSYDPQVPNVLSDRGLAGDLH